MKKITHGLLSLLLTPALVFAMIGFMPITAQAAVTIIEIGGISLDGPGWSGLPIDDPQSGTGWSWDPATSTITLGAGYVITNHIVIFCGFGDTVNLKLTSDVTIAPAARTAIDCFGNLVIDAGSFTLTATGAAGGNGIMAGGNVVINGGSVTAKSSTANTATRGITARNVIVNTGGIVSITGPDPAHDAILGNLEVSNGTVNVTGVRYSAT